MKSFFVRILQLFVFLSLGTAFYTPPVFADHAWGTYHWPRTSNPFVIKLGDNVNTTWDSHLVGASNDWSISTVLDSTIVAGSTRPKTCKPTSGRIEVCNERYGRTGWLGIAQIWASGSHITQAVAKMNDTYFTSAPYNNASWRQLVLCQEVAHGFGLDHQDEVFSNPNLGSCMDYTNNPIGNEKPNAHDYEQLETIYSHVDSLTTLNQTVAQISQSFVEETATEGGNEAKEWGKSIRDNGKTALYEKDLGNGRKLFTHVYWAQEAHDH